MIIEKGREYWKNVTKIQKGIMSHMIVDKVIEVKSDGHVLFDAGGKRYIIEPSGEVMAGGTHHEIEKSGPVPIKEGDIVRLKSGTQGWIKGRIVEYTDLMTFTPLGASIYTGPAYKVYILEGKHKGETIRVPANYVQLVSMPQTVPAQEDDMLKYYKVPPSAY